MNDNKRLLIKTIVKSNKIKELVYTCAAIIIIIVVVVVGKSLRLYGTITFPSSISPSSHHQDDSFVLLDQLKLK